MKKLMALVLSAMFLLSTVGIALAADQTITGNPAEAIAVTAPANKAAWAFAIGNNDYTPLTTNRLLVQSNVIYNVKVNADTATNKTTAPMTQYDGVSAYVVSGKVMQSAPKIIVDAAETAVTLTAANVTGLTSKAATVDAGSYHDLTIRQTVGYGDAKLTTTGHVYRVVLTWTAVATP